MIEETKDFDAFVKATDQCRELMSLDDIEKILAKPENIMFLCGNDVGLAVYDYSGVYTVHWYYVSARGRKAIELGKAMIGRLFNNHGAQTLRALIRKELKASRWACRQLGFKSFGFLEFPNNDTNEILCLTRQGYYDMKGKR